VDPGEEVVEESALARPQHAPKVRPLSGEAAHHIRVNALQKKVNDFPVPSRDVAYQIIPGLVSDIPVGDGKITNLFLQCYLANFEFGLVRRKCKIAFV
jgi:hypothetical protein